MKKSVALFFAVTILLLTSCGQSKINPFNINKSNTKYLATDFFPLIPNRCMKYISNDSNIKTYDVYVDYINDDKIQTRLVTSKDTVAYVYQMDKNSISLITSKDNFYYRDDITSSTNKNPYIVLKDPIQKGNEWIIPDGSKRTITDIDVEVDTPSGKYNAIEVTVKSNSLTLKEYYAPEVGLVKKILIEKSGKSNELVLSEIEIKKPYTQSVKIYYPDFSTGEVAFKRYTIDLETNEKIEPHIEELLKNPPSKELTPVLSIGSRIHKISINSLGNRGRIDLSKSFLLEMNAGTDLEAMLLKCITNTIGDYYNVGKVSITIDGEKYESGHIILETNQAMKVDYTHIKEVE